MQKRRGTKAVDAATSARATLKRKVLLRV